MSLPQPYHSAIPVISWGTPLLEARAAMIMLHGRGATAEDILTLAPELHLHKTAFLAPQAAGYSWYPQRFTAPLKENEPWLSSALQGIDGIFQHLSDAGIPAEKTSLLGFSQGACLALEFAARNPRRYGAIFGLSGALIGPPGMHRNPTDDLGQTPIFMGCSDVDPHIPLERVKYSANFLEQIKAKVTVRIYPGMGHSINSDELEAAHQAAIVLET